MNKVLECVLYCNENFPVFREIPELTTKRKYTGARLLTILNVDLDLALRLEAPHVLASSAYDASHGPVRNSHYRCVLIGNVVNQLLGGRDAASVSTDLQKLGVGR
jgi:hypothetical protein